MTVSAVVVAYGTGPALTRCLESLAGEVDEVVVVDNGDGSPEIEDARGRDGVRIVSPGGNLGFPAGANLGARQAGGNVLVFLNPTQSSFRVRCASSSGASPSRRSGLRWRGCDCSTSRSS